MRNHAMLFFLATWMIAGAAAEGLLPVRSLDRATTILIDSTTGNIAAVGAFSHGDHEGGARRRAARRTRARGRDGPPSTALYGCAVAAVRVAEDGGGGGGVTVERNFTCDRAAAAVTVVDTFAPAGTSVEWNTTISAVRSLDETSSCCFTVPVVSTVDFGPAADAVFAPLTSGCVANNGAHATPQIRGLCSGAWRNPLAAAPAPPPNTPSRFYRLGSMPTMPTAAAAVEPGAVGPFARPPTASRSRWPP